MKTVEYKLAGQIHPRLQPQVVGTGEPTTQKDGTVLPGKPILKHFTVKLREAETLDEFAQQFVEQDKPEEHVLSLGQAQFDIIVQRKIREFLDSSDVDDMLSGKNPETKDLSDDERVEYVLTAAEQVGAEYRYGARPASMGGGSAAAKKALADKKAIDEAAKANPEVAAKLAELQATLAGLGITL